MGPLIQASDALPYLKKVVRTALFILLSFTVSSPLAMASGLLDDSLNQSEDSIRAFTNYLDRRIPSLMNRYDIPGVVIALIKEGKPSWSKAYGYADIETAREMTVNTICRVESISKSVTAWGLMSLVEVGKVELDSPVHQYLKSWEFPPANYPSDQITVRQLLSHTSGMPLGTIGVHYPPNSTKPTLREKLTKDAILQQVPGQSFNYSNAGFNLLELLIEDVTGKDFADYMQSVVLTPLKMHRSSFEWSETFSPPVPNGYDSKGHPIPVYVYPDKASGGLFSTADDVANFVAAHMYQYNAPQVLAKSSIDTLCSPIVEVNGFYGLVFDAYGLGYFLEWLPKGEKAISHGGQGSGWMTHFQAIPETGDGIVILSNSQRSWPFFSFLLMDWAEWIGISSVGMGLIKRAGGWLMVIIIGLFLLAIRLLWHLGNGILARKRIFQIWAKKCSLTCIIQMLLFTAMASVLLWSVKQEYLMITSIFPIASVWLGIAISLLALVLLLLVLFPKIEN